MSNRQYYYIKSKQHFADFQSTLKSIRRRISFFNRLIKFMDGVEFLFVYETDYLDAQLKTQVGPGVPARGFFFKNGSQYSFLPIKQDQSCFDPNAIAEFYFENKIKKTDKIGQIIHLFRLYSLFDDMDYHLLSFQRKWIDKFLILEIIESAKEESDTLRLALVGKNGL